MTSHSRWRNSLKDQSIADQCTDPTQSITIEIPCALAERADRYAQQNDTALSNVVIEALDTFLRNKS